MKRRTLTLADLGWNAHFSSQLTADELASSVPVRVMEVQRSAIRIAGETAARSIPPYRGSEIDELSAATVGDWLLLDGDGGRPVRLIGRKSLFKRRAPGTGRRLQLIAANVDTLFIVSSCNQDFNLARLERYLALARENGVTPIIVLTKADLAVAPDDYATQVQGRLPGLSVEAVNALDPDSVACLDVWIGRGQTVGLVGSSGVGKSTLINTMLGNEAIETQAIRKDDDKGRHTTVSRRLYRLPGGGWLLDTPGMRELQLTDARAGLDEVFADIAEYARHCRW